MRTLDSVELEHVGGGVRIVLALGAAIAWAHANRASLLAIGQAAKEEDERLSSECED